MESELLIDDYEHLDSRVLYTPVNIPGPGINASVLFDEQFEGCACSGSCDVTCPCVRNGSAPFYYSAGRLRDVDHPPAMIYECHSNCACNPKSCLNRLVQKGPHANLKLVDTRAKGTGLKCNSDLMRGDFVCEYAGEVIGAQEAKARYASRQARKLPNYIFALRENFGEDSTSIVTYIDPTSIGNMGRYVNHSCDPNLLVLPVRTDTVVPKLCLFARRDIPAGTELTFNYGGEGEDIELPGNGGSICHCGTAKCRGFLPFDSSLG